MVIYTRLRDFNFKREMKLHKLFFSVQVFAQGPSAGIQIFLPLTENNRFPNQKDKIGRKNYFSLTLQPQAADFSRFFGCLKINFTKKIKSVSIFTHFTTKARKSVPKYNVEFILKDSRR